MDYHGIIYLAIEMYFSKSDVRRNITRFTSDPSV